jgi:hypothetical protein
MFIHRLDVQGHGASLRLYEFAEGKPGVFGRAAAAHARHRRVRDHCARAASRLAARAVAGWPALAPRAGACSGSRSRRCRAAAADRQLRFAAAAGTSQPERRHRARRSFSAAPGERLAAAARRRPRDRPGRDRRAPDVYRAHARRRQLRRRQRLPAGLARPTARAGAAFPTSGARHPVVAWTNRLAPTVPQKNSGVALAHARSGTVFIYSGKVTFPGAISLAVTPARAGCRRLIDSHVARSCELWD